MAGSGTVSEHALEMEPRAGLVAQIVLRDADHSLADQ
jgi:hypothetical protein